MGISYLLHANDRQRNWGAITGTLILTGAAFCTGGVASLMRVELPNTIGGKISTALLSIGFVLWVVGAGIDLYRNFNAP
jgi:hypothetical protein